MKYAIKYAEKSFKHRNDFMLFVKDNKDTFLKLKKNEVKNQSNKEIDTSVSKSFSHIQPKITATSNHIEVVSVINTTNIIDGHLDLHLPKMWNKNLKEHPKKLQLQEHRMSFEYVLSDEVKAFVEDKNFQELGLNVDFKTQALIHEFNFQEKQNPLMFKNYIEGKVREHSVGMRYVKISLAYDDPDDEKEKNYFEENKAKAVNPEIAEEKGFFWVVSEAKDNEGSPVLMGSNPITPTLIVRDYEPSKDTQDKQKPSADTSTIIQSIFNN